MKTPNWGYSKVLKRSFDQCAKFFFRSFQALVKIWRFFQKLAKIFQILLKIVVIILMTRKSFHLQMLRFKRRKTFILPSKCASYNFSRVFNSISVAESMKSTTSCRLNSDELIKDIKIVPKVISKEKQRLPYRIVNNSWNFFTLKVIMIPQRYPKTFIIPTKTSSHWISNVNSTASSCPTSMNPTMKILRK